MNIVQIETITGVENMDDILSVDGIDAAIIGSCDLGIPMNDPDHVMAETERNMIQIVGDAPPKYKIAFRIIDSF